MANRKREGATVNASLFLPVDLHARLKAEAERQHRSMHAQIIWMLERGLPVGRDHGTNVWTRDIGVATPRVGVFR
jgi:hypothetical protein